MSEWVSVGKMLFCGIHNSLMGQFSKLHRTLVFSWQAIMNIFDGKWNSMNRHNFPLTCFKLLHVILNFPSSKLNWISCSTMHLWTILLVITDWWFQIPIIVYIYVLITHIAIKFNWRPLNKLRKLKHILRSFEILKQFQRMGFFLKKKIEKKP